MKNTVDLHCHTYYSDGRASPQEMIERAAEIGLKVLAITDHESGRGSREAVEMAKKAGIELIPAIEFTSHWNAWDGQGADKVLSPDIDVLAYFINFDDPELQALEESCLGDLHDRIRGCIDRLTASGFPVSMDDVLRENPRFGGPMQLINALVKKGKVSDWDEGMKLFEGLWDSGPLGRFGIAELIEKIHSAGGAAVLAHPVTVLTANGWLKNDHIASLVNLGLDGIEIYHHRLNPEAREYFMKFARKFGLAVSGGSDEHGWPEGFPRLGSQTVTVDMVTELKRRAGN